MDVVCHYTSLAPETEAALDAAGRPWERVWVGRSDFDYFLRLADRWVGGRGFINVEHDVVVAPGTFAELEACENEWCAAPYEYHGELIGGLGCTKFADSLVERIPTLVLEAGRLSDVHHPCGHWCRLDAWTFALLKGYHVARCENHTPVVHLNPTDSHGCVAVRNPGRARNAAHPLDCSCVRCRCL